MIKTLASILIGAVVAVGGLFGVQHVTAPAVAPFFGTFSPSGGATYRLQSSVGVSNTSVALSAFKEPVSNIPYTMSYLGSTVGYGTIDPQTSRSEFISFTGITQNSNGTALLTGVTRGLTRTPAGSLCTASTTLAQAHSGQSIFILSDSPCLFAEYYVLRNNATSTGILTFSSTTPPRLDYSAAQSTGTYIATTSEFATINYVNAIAVSGSSNATESVKGISELATALEQASSTILGATGAGIVMQARYATDTPLSGCAVGYTATAGAGCSVIATLSGKIKQTWIDLTAAFNWSGLHTFSAGLLGTASSTFSATTSIQASNVLSNAVRFNAIPYAFPSAQGVNGSALVNNGSGTLSWGYPGKFNVISASGPGASGVGTFYGTSTESFTIPAGAMSASSTIVVAGNAAISSTGGPASTVSDYYLRDSTGVTLASCTVTEAVGSYSGTINFNVYNQSSASSQKALGQCNMTNGSTIYSNFGSTNTSAVNTANALTLFMVVKSVSAGASTMSNALSNFSILVTP